MGQLFNSRPLVEHINPNNAIENSLFNTKTPRKKQVTKINVKLNDKVFAFED